jgi:hypothetical protein
MTVFLQKQAKSFSFSRYLSTVKYIVMNKRGCKKAQNLPIYLHSKCTTLQVLRIRGFNWRQTSSTSSLRLLFKQMAKVINTVIFVVKLFTCYNFKTLTCVIHLVFTNGCLATVSWRYIITSAKEKIPFPNLCQLSWPSILLFQEIK